MIQSISLIQAIVLLDKREICNQSQGGKSGRIDCLESTPKTVARAAEIVGQILGRDLEQLPLRTKILLLLIEEMVEKQSAIRKIDRDKCRFTRDFVQAETGWSHFLVKRHLNQLSDLHFVSCCDPSILQYVLLYNSRRMNKLTIDSNGQIENQQTVELR